MALNLTACHISASTFPNIRDEVLPDILKKTTGTPVNTSYTSGITDNPDYQAVFTVTFEDTTDDDYHELMNHYLSASSDTDEYGYLLYDWGRLLVTKNDGSITVNALIE